MTQPSRLKRLQEADREAARVALLERSIVIGGGCREWQGCRFKITNYGMVMFNRQMWLAHRLAYEAFIGPIPQNLLVLHHCDNPPCMNPDHLFVGTAVDNTRDCQAKGRGNPPCGTRNSIAKLTDEKVAEARRLYATGGYTLAVLGRRYGVTQSTLSVAIRGIQWKHVA